MKIIRIFLILAVISAAPMLAYICSAEMQLQVSVIPVVDIYSGKLGPERTLTTVGNIEQAVLQILNAMELKNDPLPSISFHLQPATFKQLTQWLNRHELIAYYYEIRLEDARGKMDSNQMERMMLPIDHPYISSFFTTGKTYLIKIGKKGYYPASVEFNVISEQSSGPVFVFHRPSIYLTPLNYQHSAFIIESGDLRLTQSDEDELRKNIGRGLERSHHELAWFQQYRTMDDLLKCVQQTPTINSSAQTSNSIAQTSGSALQNYCGEKNLRYLIKISLGNGGD